MANSEDPNEMPQNAAFHQGLHCLLIQYQYSEKEIQFYMKITTSNPSIYTQDHSDITVSNLIENSISLQLVIDTGFLYFQIFNRLLRGFNLPVGGKIVITGRTNNKNSTQSLVNWIVSLMVSC